MANRVVSLDKIDHMASMAAQCRQDMNMDHIADLKAVIVESDEEEQLHGRTPRMDLFPPLVTFTTKELNGLHVVADGMHRREALLQAKRDAWYCEVHEVDDPAFEARMYALKANRTHGLRRSPADCRRTFDLCREWFPGIIAYGPDGIEGKTGLSRGVIGKYLKQDEARGIPTNYLRDKGKTPPQEPDHSSKTNPERQAAIAEVTDRRREEWSDPGLAFDREFRQANLTTINALRRGEDPHGIPRFDELRQEYGISSGRELDESAFTEMLLRTDPRPTASSPDVVREAGRLIETDPVEEATSQLRSLVNRLGGIVGEIDAACGKRGFEYLDSAVVGRSIKDVQAKLKASMKHSRCPRCEGEKDCTLCKGSGFITKGQFRKLDDREQRALQAD